AICWYQAFGKIRIMSKHNTPTYLFDLFLGSILWEIIESAFDLAIFDQLSSEWQSSHSIAKALSLSLKPTALLLDALCSIELIQKKDQHYKLSDSVERYLCARSTYCIKDLLLQLKNIKYADKEVIKNILKTGKSPADHLTFLEQDFWQNSRKRLYSFHQTMGTDTALEQIVKLPEWSFANTFLDLGGGSELLSERILQQHPSIHVTLFDLPKCVDKIHSSDPRLRIKAGDYNCDSLGEGYDIIWASMSLYFANNLDALLQKIKLSLSETGVFISFHEALSHERTQPESHITGRFLPSITGSDLSFTDGVIANSLNKIGFGAVSSHYVETPCGEMRVDIARLQ
ncbi:MAG: methyltransferase dimerization domain-containing protein, partial [Pseudomonadota bacterium]